MQPVTRQALSRWGQTLRQVRRSQGLSQGDLAEMVGVTTPTVSKWESGAVTIRDSHKVKVAAALNTEVGFLFPLTVEFAA